MLHTFPEALNLVQASINQSRSLLGYVSKRRKENSAEISPNSCENGALELYEAHIAELKTDTVHTLETQRSKQVRIQFLYKKKEQKDRDKFLLLVHRECKKTLPNKFSSPSQ